MRSSPVGRIIGVTSSSRRATVSPAQRKAMTSGCTKISHEGVSLMSPSLGPLKRFGGMRRLTLCMPAGKPMARWWRMD